MVAGKAKEGFAAEALDGQVQREISFKTRGSPTGRIEPIGAKAGRSASCRPVRRVRMTPPRRHPRS